MTRSTKPKPSPWPPMAPPEDELYCAAGRIAQLTYRLAISKTLTAAERAEHIAERRQLAERMAALCREAPDYRRSEGVKLDSTN